jgi:hypothetical protein
MPDESMTVSSPALSRFAQEVESLREARMPAKVGVMVPTFNRPDLARSCVLQFAAQSRAPDIICVHQNGVSDSYQWAVADLKTASRIAWLHTPQQIPQHQWYSIPLRYLIEHGCTHFFWADHDDLYLREHVERGLGDLKSFDFSTSPRCGLLFTRATDYRYNPEVDFTSHAPGGMSSTMCFNRRFAQQLLADIEADQSNQYTDNIVAHVTMPKFRCHVSQRHTSIYHSHEGSVTSHHWLPRAFGDDLAGQDT